MRMVGGLIITISCSEENLMDCQCHNVINIRFDNVALLCIWQVDLFRFPYKYCG